MDKPKLKGITILMMIAAFCDAGEPQSVTHSPSMTLNAFEFNDSPNVVIIRGNRWFPLGGGNRAAGGVRIVPGHYA